MARSLQELWAEEDAAQLTARNAKHGAARRRAGRGRRLRRRLVAHGNDRTGRWRGFG